MRHVGCACLRRTRLAALREWSAFVARRPWLTFPHVQEVSVALSAIVTVAGLAALALNRLNLGFRRVGLVGLSCAFGYPVFFSRLQLFNHPHYQFPVVWLTVAGAAGIFYALEVDHAGARARVRTRGDE